MFKKLSTVKAKAFASFTALAMAIMVPAMAFAADTALVDGAKAEITSITSTVGTIGVAILAVVGAIVAVNVVMRMLKKS